MKNKGTLLYNLLIILAGLINSQVQGQQKNGSHRANFSGEWKSKEPISMGGNIVCVYQDNDRMRSNTMKITEQADCLTIIFNSSTRATLVTNQEKLAFKGKESQLIGSRKEERSFL